MKTKELAERAVDEWQMYWMDQTQNSKEDYENYFRRAIGVDANMRANLVKRIVAAFTTSDNLIDDLMFDLQEIESMRGLADGAVAEFAMKKVINMLVKIEAYRKKL